MRKLLALALIVSAIGAPYTGNAQDERTPDWTHMHGDALHTAYSSVELAPPLTLLWKKSFSTAPHDNVVACWDGDRPLIFSGDGEGKLFCMKPDTGELIWKFDARDGGFLGSPVIFVSESGQKRVVAVSSEYLRSKENKIIAYCLDMNGKLIWEVQLNGSFCESSPTAQNGFIYVAVGKMWGTNSDGGILYKLNQETGKEVWKAELPNSPTTASPSVYNNRVYIACSKLAIGDFDGIWLGAYIRGADLAVVSDLDGTRVNLLDWGNMRMDILTVFKGNELILSGQTVAVYVKPVPDPRDPTKVLLMYYEEPKSFVARVNPENLDIISKYYPTIYTNGHIYAHSPIVSGDWIIAGADGGMIYAYNTRDPLKNWSAQLAVGVRLCMAASENFIYINEGDTPPNCCPNKKAYFKVCDITNGRVLWKHQLDNLGLGGVSVFDKYVYTFDRDNLYCFTRGKPPKLMVDPLQIDLGEIPKGKTEKTSFKVWNGGEGTLSGTVENKTAPYMKLSSPSFLVTKEVKEFICTIDTSSLTVGQVYNVPVLVKAIETGEMETVIITFTVTGQPIIKVTPPQIDFGTVEKGTYSESEVFIDNIGEGTLKGNIQSDSSWLTAEYLSWTGNHKVLKITADTTILEYNKQYKANLRFYSNGGEANAVILIRTKQKGPRLVVYPSEFEFTDVTWGDKLTGTFAVSNGGILTLEGILDPKEPWIFLSSKDFTLTTDPKNFKFEIDTKELLDNKTYTTTIMVQSNAGNKMVTIRISIKPRQPQLKVDPPTLFFNDCAPESIYDGKITISNIGGGILSGTLEPGPGTEWLKIKQGVFDISKTPLDIPIVVDTAGMAKGSSYTGKIIIKSNGGEDEVGIVVVVTNRKRFTVELWIGSNQARINGKPATLDWPPYINAGATMVPARFIAEAFGCIVDFYPKHKATEEVFITMGQVQITLYIGKNYALIGNEKVKLDFPAEIKNKRTFVPIRFISEVFGADIAWDKDTKKVTIGYWED
jgi:outer membrane protein assembly factor BamB